MFLNICRKIVIERKENNINTHQRFSCSVVSNSYDPTVYRLHCPWDSPRQEYWSDLSFPSPGIPNPGIEPGSLVLQADSYHSFLIHSSADGHLGCFHVLAIINSAAMNTEVHVYFQIMCFYEYMPTSGIAGSYGSPIFNS